ncbi:UDP-glucose:glycoprotein glucosyltransferase [Dendrobium catenatum]|uniref:UDP-glucose:glycoprotein glucosyltransferase n=1 Tax=Dendrobium catenatum TaxID=906689 RepID=A0A2I0XCV2_9ASPA|nr:UDP-glucose:glycoprotein glucosyltransferase [Dendrobium catenatum]
MICRAKAKSPPQDMLLKVEKEPKYKEEAEGTTHFVYKLGLSKLRLSLGIPKWPLEFQDGLFSHTLALWLPWWAAVFRAWILGLLGGCWFSELGVLPVAFGVSVQAGLLGSHGCSLGSLTGLFFREVWGDFRGCDRRLEIWQRSILSNRGSSALARNARKKLLNANGHGRTTSTPLDKHPRSFPSPSLATRTLPTTNNFCCHPWTAAGDGFWNLALIAAES